MNYEKYIGLPYKELGRDVTGIDCWGLVRLFYKQELGIDLPSYADLYTSSRDPDLPATIESHKDSWLLSDTADIGDVCLFNIYGEPLHVGIYIGNNKFIHARDGKDSVVESLDSTQWSKRFQGFYKYTPKLLELVGSPHPLKTSVVHEKAVVGDTVLELTKYIKQKYTISDKIESRLVVLINGNHVPQDQWAQTKLNAGDSVAYKILAEGNGGRMLLMAAVMIAAVMTGQIYGAEIATALGTSQAVGTALVTMTVNMVGMALVNAIAPIRTPDPNAAGTPRGLNLFSGSSNQINRFGSIPVVLGRMRVTGVHGATPYIDTLTDTTLMNMLIVWGFGPLTIEDLRIGVNPIQNYYDKEFAQNIPGPVHLYGYAGEDDTEFNKIYGGDVEQANVSAVELVNNTEDGNPWQNVALANPCSELGIAFSFPEGMRQLVTSGEGAGNINTATAYVEVQVRKYDTDPATNEYAWESATPYNLLSYNNTAQSGVVYGIDKILGKLSIRRTGYVVDTPLYKDYAICLTPGGGYAVLEGAGYDTYGEAIADDILELYHNNTYGSLIGTDNNFSKTPVIPASYIKMYSFTMYEGAIYQIPQYGNQEDPNLVTSYVTTLVSYLSSYDHIGLEFESTQKTDGGTVYATQIKVKTGRIYNTLLDNNAQGTVEAVFDSRELLSSSVIVPGSYSGWSGILKTFGVWAADVAGQAPLTFSAVKNNVVFKYSGYYLITGSADDEGAVYIDNRPALLMSNPAYASEMTNMMYVEAGTYPVRVTGKNSGGLAAVAAKITYQSTGGLNNLPKPSTILAFGEPGFYNKRRDAFNFVYRIKNLPRAKYEIRVRRINSDVIEPTNNVRNFHKVQLFSVTGYDYNYVEADGTIVPIRPIKDLPGSGTNKAYLARTAIRIQSTNKANGTVDGVNAVVQTMCKVWDSSTQTWKPNTATSNPAALFRYVLTHPANAYRIEESEVASRIDLVAIQEWYEFCRTHNPPLEYNSVMTNTQSVMDVLRDICAAGLASPNYVDGKWTVVVDKPRSYVTQYFTPHNSWGFEATKLLPRIPHAFRVSFANKNKAYQPDERIVYNYGYNSSTASVFEELHLPGVTDPDQAVFMARWHLAQIKLRPERYTINTDFEYLVCNRGDLVRVTHDVPLWGTGSGRIKSISGNVLELTEPVQLNPAKQYQIRIRTNTGSSVVLAIASVNTAGLYDTITATVSIPLSVESDNLFMLGEVGHETQQLVVLSIETSSNTSARITLMDYSSEIYTADLTDLLIFDPNISGVSNPIVRSTITKAPTITGVTTDDALSEEISSGTYQNVTIVSFANSPNLTVEATRVQLQCVVGNSELEDSSPASTVYTNKESGSFTVTGLRSMTMYKFRARYVNSTGTIVGPWSDIFYATVTGKTINRAIVNTVDLSMDSTYLIAKVTDMSNKPTNFKTYEYRFYKDTGTEDFWDLDPVTNNIYIVQSLAEARLNLLDIPQPRISAAGITYRVACRALDTNNNYSSDSALGTIVVTTIT